MTENNNLKFQVDIQKLRENKIFIATPMYGGMCHGGYATSMLNLSAMCKYYGIELQTYFMHNESLIPRARNYCVDEFLRSDSKHFLFIDADIEFNPQDVLILAHLQNTMEDGDIVAGVYPKKEIAWEKVAAAVEQGVAEEDANILNHFTGDYVFNALESGRFRIDEPLEVLETGTGFMMIKREAFERYMKAYPDDQFKPDHIRTLKYNGDRFVHLFFHCIIDPVSKRYLSEDYYFCQKAREAGMKVWILPWIELKHNGTYTWGGSLAALASIGQVAGTDPSKIKKK